MNIFNNLLVPTAGAVFIALGTVGVAQAVTLVAPDAQTDVEGNSSAYVPFNDGSIANRYQQVYAASEFNSLSGPQVITGISFRPDASAGNPFTSNLPSIRINLSTTNSAPDGLSSTFSENIGANNTVVYNGSLPLKSADTGSAGGPKDFDININLQTPFLYNPATGNLLLDIRKYLGGNQTTFVDAENTTGDSVSTVSTSATTADALNSLATGNVGSLGLVTQFTTTPTVTVPSPTTPVPPTEIPFDFSPGLGILMLGAWGAIAQLNSLVQKRKSSDRG